MPTPKDSELERWLAIVLRSVHLSGVVWLGGYVVMGQAVGQAPALLMLASGLVMFAMDLRAGRIALGEVAGGFVLVKLALVAWMALDPRQIVWLFWLLLVGSSIASHAPKGFRHWPTKKRAPVAPASAAGPRESPLAGRDRRATRAVDRGPDRGG